MKKILWLGILFSFLFASHSFAAYSFVPTVKGSIVNATLSGAAGSTSSFQLQIQTTPFSTSDAPLSSSLLKQSDPTIQKPDKAGLVTWSIPEKNNTTYYLRVLELPPLRTLKKPSFASDPTSIKTEQLTLYFDHVSTTKQGDTLFVEGKIDPIKQPDYLNYQVYLTYSRAIDLSNPIKLNLRSHVAGGIDTPVGISNGKDENGDPTPEDPAGSYYWVLTDLTPGATYYMQQTIVKDPANSVADRVETFNADSGAIIASTTSDTASGSGTSSDKGVYKLLSGFPGFTELPDPQVCAQQRAAAAAAGKPGPKFCDMNDVLNYAIQLMIGISALLLVFKLMYEGYIYMVSDVPFLKTNAKSGFFTAILGLLLALSSYVILNTINPRLVNESINVQQLAIGVDIVGDGTSSFTYGTKTKGLPSPVSCPGAGGRNQLSPIAMSFQNNVVYNQSLRNALQANGKVALDCSSYVAQVLSCAGYAIPGVSTGGVNTGTIFGNNAEKISSITTTGGEVVVNNKQLIVGDLLGWKGSTGHVVMYLGRGQIIDVHGPSGSTNNATVWPNINYYQSKYGFQYVYRLPN
jgi:hypothetical protein